MFFFVFPKEIWGSKRPFLSEIKIGPKTVLFLFYFCYILAVVITAIKQK